jgi:hypothetical protein
MTWFILLLLFAYLVMPTVPAAGRRKSASSQSKRGQDAEQKRFSMTWFVWLAPAP